MCHWFGFLFLGSLSVTLGSKCWSCRVFMSLVICACKFMLSLDLNPVSLTLEAMCRECSYKQTLSFLKVC